MEPATIWSGQNGEYTYPGTVFIIDPNGNFIVDPAHNFIVDTGISLTPDPATVWSVNDAA